MEGKCLEICSSSSIDILRYKQQELCKNFHCISLLSVITSQSNSLPVKCKPKK